MDKLKAGVPVLIFVLVIVVGTYSAPIWEWLETNIFYLIALATLDMPPGSR